MLRSSFNKKGLKVAVAACAVSVGCAAGWTVVKLQARKRNHDVYSKMAVSIGIEQDFWRKVGVVLDKATARKATNLTLEDYDLLYQAIETGIPRTQIPALMALNRCPPRDKNRCFRVIEKAVKTTTDAEFESWAYGSLWNITPNRHHEIRKLASASKFNSVRVEVNNWPEVFPKEGVK